MLAESSENVKIKYSFEVIFVFKICYLPIIINLDGVPQRVIPQRGENLTTAERNSHNTITFNNISKPPVTLGSLTLVSFSCVRGGETATSPDHRFLLELLLSDTSATYERFGTYGCLACSSSSSSWDDARDIRRPRQPLLPPPSCVRKTSEKYEVESLSSRPPFPVSVVDKTATFPGYWLPAVCHDHCVFTY